MDKDILCPNCKNKIYFCLDEWGYTPWHLHCKTCDINIGTTSQKKTVELLNEFHDLHTWIEFYNGTIQILNIDGKYLIFKKVGI